MESVLDALNQLVQRGVIRDYAIGGAIGASFYIDAVQTEDVDAFVFLPVQNSLLITLEPVYRALAELGGVPEQEYVRFGEWPLQVLTDATPLITEAIESAVAVDYEGIPARVFRPEYLCAIALQTGRSKDYLRVIMFLEQNVVDRTKLAELTSRYGLAEQLQRAVGMMR